MRILTYIISPTSIRIYSLMFCFSHIFNQLYPKTKQRKNKNQPRTIQYFDQRSTNHALNDERDISLSLSLSLGKIETIPIPIPRLVDWIYRAELFPWFIGRFKGDRGTDYVAISVVEGKGKKRGAGEKRLKKREEERCARWGRVATIDGNVWEANYLPGASCHRAWRSFDRGKVRFRRLSI